MQFWFTIAVLAAILSDESVTEVPLTHVGLRIALAAIAMLLVSVTANLIASRFIKLWHEPNLDKPKLIASLDRAQRIHAGMSLMLTLGILFGLSWAQLIHVNSGLAEWPVVDHLCLLLPTVLPLLLSWMAYYRIDLAVASSSPEGSVQPESLPRYLLWHVRQHLAPLLVPAICLLALEDLVRRSAPQWVEQSQAWAWGLPALALVLIGFPILLRRLWKTEKLPKGPLNDAVQAAIAEQGLGIRNVFIWHTGGRMVNAAVTGFLPRLRYIFLTDTLLARFNSEQVAAVVAHELGHVRGRHLLLRMIALLTPALFLMALGRYISTADLPESTLQAITSTQNILEEPTGEPSSREPVSTFHAGLSFTMSELLLPIGLLIYAGTVLGRYSRFLELEADYLACCPVSCSIEDHSRSGRMSISQTETFLSMLAQLAVTADTPPEKATWLHPSLTHRGSFLLTMLNQPSAQLRFEKHLRCSRLLLISALVLGLLVYCGTG